MLINSPINAQSLTKNKPNKYEIPISQMVQWIHNSMIALYTKT